MNTARDAAKESLIIGPWTYDVALRRLVRGADVVRLRPKTAALLLILARAAPQPVSRDDLLSRVWPDVYVSDESLTAAVADLRRAFGQKGRAKGPIETVQKAGYRLCTPQNRLSTPARAPQNRNQPLNVIDARLACQAARDIRQKQGEWAAAQALSLCAQAVQMAPDMALIQAEYALSAADCRLYAPEGFDDLGRAFEGADTAIALRPDSPTGHMARGALCDAAGDMTGALRSYAAAVQRDPTDAECHLLLARALYAGGDMARAAQMAGIAAALAPQDYRPPYLMAGARAALGDTAGSVRAAETGLARLATFDLQDPAEQRAQNIKGSLLARAGRPAAALDALTAHERSGGRVTYYNAATLGWAGEVSAALDRLEQAFDGGFRHLRWARCDPALAALRKERRFKRLLAGLPE